ncbi:MAG: NAD(P)-dependent oxidoreductase [Marmoricola sp.]
MPTSTDPTAADLGALAGKTVAIIGYGNQGHAQAQNLRDSGVSVLVGNRDDEYAERARAAGFDVRPIDEASAAADVLLLLIPDEVQPEVFTRQVAPVLTDGATLVVASGYCVTFDLLDLPAETNVVMVAPRMIGEGVRKQYREGVGFPCLLSVEHDATGEADSVAQAIARGIGVTAHGAVASSAREEAALDLFSEQAIWPTIFALLQAAFEVLHGAGFNDVAIVDEMYLSGEPSEVFERAARLGLLGQLTTHSRTSQFGQLRGLSRSADLVDTLKEKFSGVLADDILSGAFAHEWSAHEADSEAAIAALRQKAADHPLIGAEERVRAVRQAAGQA